MNYRDFATTERIGLVTWSLMLGTAFTTAQVADLTGLTWGGAYRMLYRLSRVLPIYRDDDGRWTVLAAVDNFDPPPM